MGPRRSRLRGLIEKGCRMRLIAGSDRALARCYCGSGSGSGSGTASLQTCSPCRQLDAVLRHSLLPYIVICNTCLSSTGCCLRESKAVNVACTRWRSAAQHRVWRQLLLVVICPKPRNRITQYTRAVRPSVKRTAHKESPHLNAALSGGRLTQRAE